MKGFRSELEQLTWKRVKDLSEFHWSDIAATGVHDDTAQKYVRRWERAGRIICIRKDMHRKVYRNADIGPVSDPHPISAEATPEGNMWRAMRQLRQFSPIDVAAHANAGGIEVTVEKARSYCRQLLASRHLKVRQTAIPGRREALYQIVEDTGPRPPRAVRLAGILDPNTGDFSPAKGGAA